MGFWNRRNCAGALAGAACLALMACGNGGSARNPEGSESWDLVIVVLDTLRADAIGAYGYGRPTTPAIDRFASRAVRFEEAWSSASYTLASTASLFTGLAPAAHGVVGLQTNLLARDHQTIAETLRDAGFATAAFSCNHHITREGGFAQGFEHFQHYLRDRFDLHAVPEDFKGDVLSWWSENDDQRRFLYLHLLPPHQPYDPPPPHSDLFGADATERRMGLTDYLVDLKDEAPFEPSDPRLAQIRSRYDAGVHYADAVFADLMESLDELGAEEGAMVVLLSDHGEGFGDHGQILHGSTAYREETRVPLVVRYPGVEPGARDALVRLRDIPATVSGLLGAPWSPDEARGSSFAGALLDPTIDGGPPVVSRSIGTTPIWCLRNERWTLLEHRGSGSLGLFDRRRDPKELRNLAAEEPELADQLATSLASALERSRKLRRSSGFRAGRVTDWNDQLRELGYTDD